MHWYTRRAQPPLGGSLGLPSVSPRYPSVDTILQPSLQKQCCCIVVLPTRICRGCYTGAWCSLSCPTVIIWRRLVEKLWHTHLSVLNQTSLWAHKGMNMESSLLSLYTSFAPHQSDYGTVTSARLLSTVTARSSELVPKVSLWLLRKESVLHTYFSEE